MLITTTSQCFLTLLWHQLKQGGDSFPRKVEKTAPIHFRASGSLFWSSAKKLGLRLNMTNDEVTSRLIIPVAKRTNASATEGGVEQLNTHAHPVSFTWSRRVLPEMRSLNYGKENTDAEMKMGKPIPEASFTEHHTARFWFAVKMPNKLWFVCKIGLAQKSPRFFIQHHGIGFEVHQ